MGTASLANLGTACFVWASIAGRQAMQMRKGHDYRASWGWAFWAVLPVAAFALLSFSSGGDMTARNITLGSLGALLGAFALIWVGYLLDGGAKAQSSTSPEAPVPPPVIHAPNNQGIVTNNQQGNNTIIQEDRSIKRRQRDLLDSIDPRILSEVSRGQVDLKVRLQSFEVDRLQTLISEGGTKSLVNITGYGGVLIDSLINNGSLGTTQAVYEQRWVFLSIKPDILQ